MLLFSVVTEPLNEISPKLPLRRSIAEVTGSGEERR